MKVFQKVTNKNENLINIFSNQIGLPVQIQDWWRQVKDTVYKCFKKVRLKKRMPKFCPNFKKRKRAIRENNFNAKTEAENMLRIEQHDLGLEKIKRNMSILKASKNSQKSPWDLKKIFSPKIKPTLPIAKRSMAG